MQSNRKTIRKQKKCQRLKNGFDKNGMLKRDTTKKTKYQ